MKVGQLKAGDILLYKDSSIPLSNLVKKATDGKYYHSAVYVGNGKINHVLINGKKTDKVIDKEIGQVYDVYRPEYKDIVEAVQESKITFSQILGYGVFNFIGLFIVPVLKAFSIQWFQGKKFMTCSEFCINVLLAGGAKRKSRLAIISSLSSPNDIDKLFELEKIL